MVPMYGPCMAFARLRSPTTDSVTHGGLRGPHSSSAAAASEPRGPRHVLTHTRECGAIASVDPVTPARKRGPAPPGRTPTSWGQRPGLLPAGRQPSRGSPPPKSQQHPQKGVKREQV